MKHLHIFLTGTTNSGTGFLRFFFLKHPELSVLEQEGHHYSKILPNDNQFPKIKNRLFALYPQYYRWTAKDVNRINTRRIRKDFYKHWDLNKYFLMEKSPHHMIRLKFMDNVFKQSKFICIVRNGYVVSEGINRRKGHKMKQCAKHWSLANQIMTEDSSKVNIKIIKYEDLCKNPQENINDLCNFIGIDKIEIDLDEKIPRQNLFGKNKFFTLRNMPDFNKESIKRLTKEDIGIINERASDILKYFDYNIL